MGYNPVVTMPTVLDFLRTELLGDELAMWPSIGRLGEIIVSETHLAVGEAGVRPCEVAVFGAKARALDLLPNHRRSS